MTSPVAQLSGRTVLVTGASGFLGQWLLPELRDAGARVVGLSRRSPPDSVVSSDWITGDVLDYEAVRSALSTYPVDLVYHLAARSKADRAQVQPIDTFEVNVRGTWNVLEAARRADRAVQVVLSSTDLAEEPGGTGASVRSVYGTSKACAEAVAQCFHSNFGLQVAVARTCNLYGGGDSGFQRIIPGTIRSVARGEAPIILSDGAPLRDYLYVEDAVSGYLRLGERLGSAGIGGETFHFGAAAPASVLDIVQKILKLMDRSDIKPDILGRSGGPDTFRHLDSRRACERLGWTPAISLDAGLARTVDWYLSNPATMEFQE